MHSLRMWLYHVRDNVMYSLGRYSRYVMFATVLPPVVAARRSRTPLKKESPSLRLLQSVDININKLCCLSAVTTPCICRTL